MWFYDISDQQWHKASGMVGEPAICGKRWGGTALDMTMRDPDYGGRCPGCEVKTGPIPFKKIS